MLDVVVGRAFIDVTGNLCGTSAHFKVSCPFFEGGDGLFGGIFGGGSRKVNGDGRKYRMNVIMSAVEIIDPLHLGENMFTRLQWALQNRELDLDLLEIQNYFGVEEIFAALSCRLNEK